MSTTTRYTTNSNTTVTVVVVVLIVVLMVVVVVAVVVVVVEVKLAIKLIQYNIMCTSIVHHRWQLQHLLAKDAGVNCMLSALDNAG